MPEESIKINSEIRLSEIVEQLIARCKSGDMTVGELMHEISHFGHLMTCIIFCLPFLMPIPLPGISILFGLIVAIAGLQDVIGVDPWLPKSWKAKKVPPFLINKILYGLDRLLLRTEKVIKPRLHLFARHPWISKFNGILIVVLAILLSLPMPPGFNAPPAIAIIILCVGGIEQDGVAVIWGYILSALNAVLFGAVFVLGMAGLKELF